MQNIRYIESMDSVRFNLDDEMLQPKGHIKPNIVLTDHQINEKNAVTLKMRESQLLIEILISMLFGYRIAVQQSFSFDSLGFLKAFDSIIKKRDKMEKHLIPPAFRNPFIFSFFKPSEMDLNKKSEYYMKVVANSLKNPDFRLSGWTEIDENLTERTELASLLLNMNIDKAVEKFSFLEDKIETIHRISMYVSRTPYLLAKPRSYNLQSLIYWIKNIPESISIENIPPDFIKELKDNINKLEEAKIPFSNRSKVRQNGKDILPLNDLVPLIEYVDTIYNIVVSDSMGTHSEILSTSSQINNRSSDFGKTLARIAAQFPYGLERDKFIKHDKECLSMSMKLSFENLTFFNKLLENSIEEVWQTIADQKWQESIDKLHSAMINNSEEILDLSYNHICLLSDKLKSIMIKSDPTDNKSFGLITGTLGVTIGAGTTCYFLDDLSQIPYIAEMIKLYDSKTVETILTGAGGTFFGGIGSKIGEIFHDTKNNIIYEFKSIGSAWKIKRALEDSIVIG